jgi:hypothetical protein
MYCRNGSRFTEATGSPSLIIDRTDSIAARATSKRVALSTACGCVNIWWNFVEKVKTPLGGQITPVNTYLLCNNQRHVNESDFSAMRLPISENNILSLYNKSRKNI